MVTLPKWRRKDHPEFIFIYKALTLVDIRASLVNDGELLINFKGKPIFSGKLVDIRAQIRVY